jgi:hypothetical protein
VNTDPKPEDELSDIAADAENYKALEAIVRAAGRYVVPSESLRPSTLQAARDYCDDRRSVALFGKLLIALVVFCLLASPAIDRFVSSSAGTQSYSDEMHRRAMEIDAEKHIGLDWGLQEAFSNLRKQQAAHFENSLFRSESLIHGR